MVSKKTVISPLKTRRYDSNSIRLMRGEHIVGMLLKMADGTWGIYDKDEKRLTKTTYGSSHMAAKKAEELIAP